MVLEQAPDMTQGPSPVSEKPRLVAQRPEVCETASRAVVPKGPRLVRPSGSSGRSQAYPAGSQPTVEELANLIRAQAVAVLKARRARARATASAGRLPPLGARASLGLATWSYLQTRSVGPSVLALYVRLYAEFTGFASAEGLDCTPLEGLDKAMVDFLDWLYAEGRQADIADKVTAAVLFHRLDIAALGPRALARVKQATKGFRKLAPARSRIPLPWE